MNAKTAEMTSELKIRTSIEDQLIPELHSTDTSDPFEVSLVVPFINVKQENAVIHITEFDDSIHVEIMAQNHDLSSLQRDWNGVTYPKPTNALL